MGKRGGRDSVVVSALNFDHWYFQMASTTRKQKFFDPKFFEDDSPGEGDEKKEEGDLSFELPTPDSSPKRATPPDNQSKIDVGKKCGAKPNVITKPKMNSVKQLID